MFTVPQSLLSRLRDPDGGFTWQPTTGETPSWGYAVAAFPQVEMVFSVEAAIRAGVERFIASADKYLRDRRHYIGAWHNPLSGLVYLDISVVVPTEAEAQELCRRFNQLAYYDFAACRSVEVKETANV